MLRVRLLVLAGLLIQGNHASHQNLACQPGPPSTDHSLEQWLPPVPNINSAFEGFDPLKADPLSKHDPGMRQQIFEPLHLSAASGRVTLNSFIGKARQDIHCSPDFTTTTISDYEQYRARSTASFYQFAPGADVAAVDAVDASETINFKQSTGLGRQESQHEQEIRSFFQETAGEVVMTSSECITHSVTIHSFAEAVFTPGFRSALKKLHAASLQPHSAESNSTAKTFFTDYGSHFMREVKLGSRLWFAVRLKARSANYSEQQRRQKCTEQAAYSSLAESTDDSFALVRRNFLASINETCLPGFDSMDMISVGAFPRLTMTMRHPVPIAATIEKVSRIFLSDRIRSLPLVNGQLFNASRMVQFLEMKMASYCQLMLGQPCDGYFNSTTPAAPQQPVTCATEEAPPCSAQHEHEQSIELGSTSTPPSYGAVIISGGFDGNNRLKSVEVLDGSRLPDLPVAVSSLTLTAVGHLLYSCGGWSYVPGANCYQLDIDASSPRWTPIQALPSVMAYHTAVAVGTHIWFVYLNKLHDLDTASDLFRTHDLSFDVSVHHCAVSNGTHSYIIGVGRDRRDIMVNSRAGRPDRWERVASLGRGRRYHGCLWLGAEVYITGGYDRRSDVEVLNTRTHEVTAMGGLQVGREYHGMMVLGGSPAVVGGDVGGTPRYTDSIEIFDGENWVPSSRKLQARRADFGLAQLQHDRDNN